MSNWKVDYMKVQMEVKIRNARPAPWGGEKVFPALSHPAKRRLCPAPPHPVKITKTCGAQRGKLDFNPLKFGRQLQGRIQFCPINICLTHKSVDFRAFLPRLAPWIFPLPCPTRPALWPKSSAPCIPGENALPVTVWVKRCQFLVLVLRRPNRHLF